MDGEELLQRDILKTSMPAGGRFYAARDYENCMNFLAKAAEMKLPLYKLITHRYKLEEINEAMWTVVIVKRVLVLQCLIAKEIPMKF